MTTALHHPSLITVGEDLFVLPVARGDVHFTNEVRRGLFAAQPDIVAVELPAALRESVLAAVAQLPRLALVAYSVPGTQAIGFVPNDPCDAMVEAIRMALEHGLELHFVDTVEAGRGESHTPLPDGYAAERIGAAEFARSWVGADPDRGPTDQERVVAGRVARLASRGRVVFVAALARLSSYLRLLREPACGDHPDEATSPLTARVLPVQEKHLGLVLREIPYLAWLFENFRESAGPNDPFPVLEALGELLHRAAIQYGEEYDEAVNLTEWRALFQFGRNLSLVRGRLRPDFYELVTAAKACVDDDFGAIVLEIASSYPELGEEDTAPDGDEQPAGRHRSLRLHLDVGDGLRPASPAYPWPDLEELEFNFKRRRPTPREKLDWQREFLGTFGAGICSWPPEDERIETFFAHLRRRALQSITADHTLVEEFTSSMHDGLDFRETMRNWHTGKLYVRRERQPPGKVGPVAVVWRDFPIAARGLWRSTLYAENQNESDIAVYCSPLGREMVGPMIARTDYHGILSVFPARGIPDVWALPQLYAWGTCGRLLLASAILLSEEKYVAWVAAKPPDRDLRELARARRVGIIHLPLAGFSRKTLKRLRQVHILGSHSARTWAADYIQD